MIGEVGEIALDLKDISNEWQNFLNELWLLAKKLKVPIKAKLYEQKYVRTMFLQKCEFITIDGIQYEVGNTASVELWNCK